MNKNILTCLLGNEAKPFFVVEPLYFATCHNFSPDDRTQLPDELPRAIASVINQVVFSGWNYGNKSDNKNKLSQGQAFVWCR
jgi:hypothetical protein